MAHLEHAGNNRQDMAVLVDRKLSIHRTLVTNMTEASAIEDPTRARIIELLYHRTFTAEQISEKLAKRGHKKALTTVRHHIDVLRDAGLIDIARVEETRGGITKHYGTAIRLLGYDTPADFDTKYSGAIKLASKELSELIKTLMPKATPKSVKKKSDPAYIQYVLAEILNRAMTANMEKDEAKLR